MLGHEVGVVQPLGLIEHVFAEDTFVQTRCGDGRHMVEMPGIDGAGKLHRVARAFHVDGHLAFSVGRQVVHRRQVMEMVDLALELFHVLGGHAQLLGGQVAKHRNGARRAHAPIAAQFSHLVRALLAQQEVHHAALALQKFFDQTLADEPCGSCHEILHAQDSCWLCCEIAPILAQARQCRLQQKPAAMLPTKSIARPHPLCF